MMKLRFYRSPDGDDAPAAIDFDKLSAAEGDDSLSNLPFIGDQIQAEMDAANGIAQVDWQKDFEPVNNLLRTKYGDDFKLPEDTTKENYYEKLLETVEQRTAPKELEVSDNIKKIIEAEKKGIPFEEYVKNYTSLSSYEALTPQDRVKQFITEKLGQSEARPNGLTPEQVQQRIERLENSGALELEDARLLDTFNERKANLQNEMLSKREREIEEYNLNNQKQHQQAINDTLNIIGQKKDFFGIPVTQSEIQEFKQDFVYLTTVNPKTGEAPLSEMLQSNEFLAQVAFLALKGNDKIKGALSAAKTQAKEGFISKLDSEPRIQKKSGGEQNPNIIDYDALSAPSTY
jgi:hypothetical protein